MCRVSDWITCSSWWYCQAHSYAPLEVVATYSLRHYFIPIINKQMRLINKMKNNCGKFLLHTSQRKIDLNFNLTWFLYILTPDLTSDLTPYLTPYLTPDLTPDLKFKLTPDLNSKDSWLEFQIDSWFVFDLQYCWFDFCIDTLFDSWIEFLMISWLDF